MAHPLSGADLGTVARVFADGGAPDRWGAAAALGAMAMARAPFSAVERLVVTPRLPALEEMPAPVFILGHWRSGTTHLYNTMCRDPNWAYVPPFAVGLPWDMFGLGRAFRPAIDRALPRHRWIDRMPVTPTSPQEDEVAIASMSELSFYHGIYFPRRFDALIDRGLFFDGATPAQVARWERRFTHFLRKVAMAQDGRALLIKNPVYTGRVAMLRRMFPRAKFVHIHRDPVDVFLSMRNFYEKLLERLALQDVPDGLDVEDTILRVYDRMMERLVDETRDLPAGSLVELPYAELDRDPLGAIGRVYEGLGLDGFDAARPAFADYLASVSGFEKNGFQAGPAVLDRVARHWSRWIERWGYGPQPPSPAMLSAQAASLP